MYPDTKSNISQLHLMGGNHLGMGNVSKCAEFNFWSDPEAANIVFEEATCEIFVFPWEPCLESALEMPFDDWRLNVLASNKNRFTNLLDPVEIKAYRKVLPNWTPCDNFLACCFIQPKLIKKMEKVHATVELAGNHTRGMMIIDHLQRNPMNVHVIKEIHMDLFKKFMLWVCDHGDDHFDF